MKILIIKENLPYWKSYKEIREFKYKFIAKIYIWYIKKKGYEVEIIE